MGQYETFFTKRLIDNPNTKRSYTRSFDLFFEHIQKNPKEYFKNGNDYEADVGSFYFSLAEQNLPSMTIKTRMNAIKILLLTYDKSTRDLGIWDTVRGKVRGAEPVSEETPLSAEDINKILQYADVCGKAMFLMMCSSGMRIESLVGLLPDDIHDDETPCRIVLRAEIVKGKKKKITTFITPEATDAYRAWLKIRSQWLASAIKRTTMPVGGVKGAARTIKSGDDPRVFPMTDVNVRLMWSNLIKKAGYDQKDKKTHRSLAHVHSLRKFMRTWFGNLDLAEHLLGHTGYLSTYRQYDYKQLGKEYLKYCQNVSIFSRNADYTKTQEELREKDAQIKSLQDKLDQKTNNADVEALRSELTEFKEAFQRIMKEQPEKVFNDQRSQQIKRHSEQSGQQYQNHPKGKTVRFPGKK